MKDATLAVWASIVRTIVPLIVGWVISWAVGLGIQVDDKFEGTFSAFLTLVFTAVYYILVRVFETYVSPRFGWLLGLAKTPDAYTTPSPAKHVAE